MQTNDYRTTWEIYAKAWSGVDAAERQALLDQSVHPDCLYTDPMVQCRGHRELIAYLEQFQIGLPGGSFKTHSFRNHHDQALADWDMLDGSGSSANLGTSFVRFDESGRLVQITGFFAVRPQ